MIGFIKWLITQYRTYQLEQAMAATKKEYSDIQMMNAYKQCLDAGPTPAQISALANFLLG